MLRINGRNLHLDKLDGFWTVTYPGLNNEWFLTISIDNKETLQKDIRSSFTYKSLEYHRIPDKMYKDTKRPYLGTISFSMANLMAGECLEEITDLLWKRFTDLREMIDLDFTYGED